MEHSWSTDPSPRHSYTLSAIGQILPAWVRGLLNRWSHTHSDHDWRTVGCEVITVWNYWSVITTFPTPVLFTGHSCANYSCMFIRQHWLTHYRCCTFILCFHLITSSPAAVEILDQVFLDHCLVVSFVISCLRFFRTALESELCASTLLPLLWVTLLKWGIIPTPPTLNVGTH